MRSLRSMLSIDFCVVLKNTATIFWESIILWYLDTYLIHKHSVWSVHNISDGLVNKISILVWTLLYRWSNNGPPKIHVYQNLWIWPYWGKKGLCRCNLVEELKIRSSRFIQAGPRFSGKYLYKQKRRRRHR